MGLAAIRDGIKTRLGTISGLRSFDTVPESVNEFPAAVVKPSSGELDPAFGDAGPVLIFVITILVTRQDLATAQDALDPYLDVTGASSIRAAIEGDPTLNSSCDSCRVTRFAEYGAHEHAGILLLGVNIYLEVNP